MSGTNKYLNPIPYVPLDSESEESVPIYWWHPKLTFYRFLVLSTTIGLGTAKAYGTSRGLNLVSTTIEWVAGMVLFSVLSYNRSILHVKILIHRPRFFILGLFEPSPPRRLSWLLEYDLMDLIWMLFPKTCLPQYRTDEIQPESRQYKLSHPPLTGYRLLTSVLVISFGLSKAYLLYGNLSEEANGVDWIYGVAITSR
jgi:hypothetical protein